jgi:DNA-binding transcriptional ArsR family regulator
MDEVFKALADASRRRLLDSLNARNGQSLRELCAGLDMARQSVSKHLAVLEAASLVTVLWRGREKLHYLNVVPINAIAERWISQYDRERADPDQVVLESEPYRRLSYTWHTFSPEWAGNYGFSEEYRAKLASERRSKVTFEIEQLGPMVKLTVRHDDFEPGSIVLEGISQGWPVILASLKTLLETGQALPSPQPA